MSITTTTSSPPSSLPFDSPLFLQVIRNVVASYATKQDKINTKLVEEEEKQPNGLWPEDSTESLAQQEAAGEHLDALLAFAWITTADVHVEYSKKHSAVGEPLDIALSPKDEEEALRRAIALGFWSGGRAVSVLRGGVEAIREAGVSEAETGVLSFILYLAATPLQEAQHRASLFGPIPDAWVNPFRK